jgi:hypothetical protein
MLDVPKLKLGLRPRKEKLMVLLGIGRTRRAGEIEKEYAFCAVGTCRSRRIQSRAVMEFEGKTICRGICNAPQSCLDAGFRKIISRQTMYV